MSKARWQEYERTTKISERWQRYRAHYMRQPSGDWHHLTEIEADLVRVTFENDVTKAITRLNRRQYDQMLAAKHIVAIHTTTVSMSKHQRAALDRLMGRGETPGSLEQLLVDLSNGIIGETTKAVTADLIAFIEIDPLLEDPETI
jgi:hypothetical protein